MMMMVVGGPNAQNCATGEGAQQLTCLAVGEGGIRVGVDVHQQTPNRSTIIAVVGALFLQLQPCRN